MEKTFMKKLILLFTIACAAGQLHGMEAQNIMDLRQRTFA